MSLIFPISINFSIILLPSPSILIASLETKEKEFETTGNESDILAEKLENLEKDLAEKESIINENKDLNEFFRIGFKDRYKNRGLNDIRVQLQGNGIYTFGINSIIELLKDSLKEVISDYIPITRADLNCFIQYDFSFVKKDMFSTRKRQYSTINEIGNANTTQTLYVLTSLNK